MKYIDIIFLGNCLFHVIDGAEHPVCYKTRVESWVWTR